MSQTTPKTITLNQLYEESGIEKYCTLDEFRKMWNRLTATFIRDGLGMGKRVKLPFGLGTFISTLYKPKSYKIDKQKSKEYGVEYYDTWNELNGLKIMVKWYNAYNFYPNTFYYTYILNGRMFKLLRKYTGENNLTQRI